MSRFAAPSFALASACELYDATVEYYMATSGVETRIQCTLILRQAFLFHHFMMEITQYILFEIELRALEFLKRYIGKNESLYCNLQVVNFYI